MARDIQPHELRREFDKAVKIGGTQSDKPTECLVQLFDNFRTGDHFLPQLLFV